MPLIVIGLPIWFVFASLSLLTLRGNYKQRTWAVLILMALTSVMLAAGHIALADPTNPFLGLSASKVSRLLLEPIYGFWTGTVLAAMDHWGMLGSSRKRPVRRAAEV